LLQGHGPCRRRCCVKDHEKAQLKCVLMDRSRRTASASVNSTGARETSLHSFIVLDRWKWVVVVMQKLLPLLICRGAAEPDGVILDGSPLDEEDVPIFGLNAASQFVGDISGRCGNDRCRLRK